MVQKQGQTYFEHTWYASTKEKLISIIRIMLYLLFLVAILGLVWFLLSTRGSNKTEYQYISPESATLIMIVATIPVILGLPYLIRQLTAERKLTISRDGIEFPGTSGWRKFEWNEVIGIRKVANEPEWITNGFAKRAYYIKRFAINVPAILDVCPSNKSAQAYVLKIKRDGKNLIRGASTPTLYYLRIENSLSQQFESGLEKSGAEKFHKDKLIMDEKELDVWMNTFS
ncbi:MAG: hypothetical protein V1728_06320 [Candidatus Micrarchaeota archaeon]